MSIRLRVHRIAALFAFAACSSDATSSGDVTGTYTVAVTNGDNGCNAPNWTVGNTATAIPFTVTQQGSQLQGVVGGVAGGYLDLVLGSSTFSGSSFGASIDMTLAGTRSATQSGCTYTVNGHLTATLTGDALQGTIDYYPATDGSGACQTVSACRSERRFSGSRPPR